MRKRQAFVIFTVAAVAAWFAAYAPDMVRRSKVSAALDAPIGRWVCIVNADAVSTQVDPYVSRKYLMLGGQRYYSDEFKKWGRSADYMLAVIDDKQRLTWTRLDFDETSELAKAYGINRAGCRRIEADDRATARVVPVTPPVHIEGTHGAPNPPESYLRHPEDYSPRPDMRPVNQNYGNALSPNPSAAPVVQPESYPSGAAPREGTSGNFDWKKAVEPALGPQR